MIHVNIAHNSTDIPLGPFRLKPVIEGVCQKPQVVTLPQQMKGIRAVFTSAVGHQAIIATFTFVLLDKLQEFVFVFGPDGTLLVKSLRRPTEVTNTFIIKPYPDKTFVQHTFFTRLHKTINSF